jgi:hypothetical protein
MSINSHLRKLKEEVRQANLDLVKHEPEPVGAR